MMPNMVRKRRKKIASVNAHRGCGHQTWLMRQITHSKVITPAATILGYRQHVSMRKSKRKYVVYTISNTHTKVIERQIGGVVGGISPSLGSSKRQGHRSCTVLAQYPTFNTQHTKLRMMSVVKHILDKTELVQQLFPFRLSLWELALSITSKEADMIVIFSDYRSPILIVLYTYKEDWNLRRYRQQQLVAFFMHKYTICSVLANKCNVQLSIVVLNSCIEKELLLLCNHPVDVMTLKLLRATCEGLPAVMIRR